MAALEGLGGTDDYTRQVIWLNMQPDGSLVIIRREDTQVKTCGAGRGGVSIAEMYAKHVLGCRCHHRDQVKPDSSSILRTRRGKYFD